MSPSAQENTQKNSDTKYDFQRFGSLKVSQAAKILDISPSSLRRFEEEGRITSERSSGNNYRTYRLDLVNRLKAELKNEDNNKKLLVEKKKLKKVQRHSSKKINAGLIKTEPKIIPSTPILNMDIPSVPYYVKPYVPISPSTKKLDVSIKTKGDKEEDSDLSEVTPSYEKMVTYKPAVSRLSFGRTLSLVSALLLVSTLLLFPIKFSRFFSDFKYKVQNGLANVKDLPNVLSILNIRSGKLTENKAATPSELLANVLAASARVSNYVFNFNIPVFFKKPVTFEDTLTANQLATFNAGIATTNVTFKGTGLINNLLGIDTVTKTTLERELDIDGQVTSTGMGNTIINNGVITGPMLNSNISYSGKFNFAGTIALKGTTITSTAAELNQLAGLAYESGGIFYGDGAGFYQDTSYLFWDSVNKNLGIGTSSPTATLEIISSGTGTSTSTLWTKNSLGITGLFVQNTGNVGIGTTAPATALEIGGIGNLRIGGLTPLSGVYTDANNTLVSALPTSGALGYWQRNSTNLSPSIITDNVGIGTTAPGSKLSVAGGASIGLTYAGTSAPSNGMIIEGNVGIGTTAPVNKLDVFGGMAIGSYAGVNTAPSNGLLVSGSVGIGTTSPTYTLDVNGTSRTTGEMTGGASLTLTNDIIARDQLRIGDADNTIFNYIANSVLGASTAMTSNIDLYIQGNLEVGGNVVTGTGSGTFGYWTRDSGTSTISPVYSGDVVRIPGPFIVENSSTVKTTSSTAFIVQSGSSANTFVVDTAGNIVNVYGTINTTGAISAPTNTNTINGLVINTGNITSGTWNGDNISLGRGGTGASLTDPNADRIMFWDDSANSTSWLTAGSGLYLSETNPGAVTLNIGAGDGIIVSATSVAVNLSTSGTSPTTSSNSGLEVASTGLRMLGGCSSAQILSWNASSAKWECQTITGMPGVITGLGAAGQVTFWTGETSLTGSDNFFWNNGTGKLGLGTTNPTSKLTITPSDAAAFQINPFGAGAGSTGELRMLELVSNGTNYTGFKAPDSLNDDVIYTLPSSSATSADYILTWQGGNVLQWKEVTGVGGAGDITSVGSTISGAAFSDSTATNQWLGLGASAGKITFIDATPDYINFSDANVGIGTTAPAYPLEVNGSVLGGGVLLNNSGDIGFGAVDPDLISLASGAVTINGTLTTTGAINGLTISSGNITAGTWGGDVISVPYGGTGAVTLGAHSVLLGAGTGPVTALTAGETGQLLLGVTGANPIFAAMSGDATITNSGALTLASTSVVAGTYGNSTNIPQITVDNKGRITAVANQAISYESPLTFTNGLTRTDNDVHLGGVLSENTRIYSSSGPDILFLDNTNSRVGIGTTTPSALLNIVSDSSDNLFLIEKTDGFDLFRVVGQSGYTEATGDLVSGGYGYWMKNFAAPQRFYIGHTTTTEPSIVVNASGAVSFHSYGTQPLVLNTEYGGNVGIGTTSPGAALEVSNTTLPQFRIRYDATRYMDVSNNGIFNLVSANVNDYNFQIEGTSKLFIQHTTGNVGIGTTNPISLLSVGAASQFQVNSTGNIVLLNNVITSFPSSQGVAGSLMTNDGAGVLSWAPPSGTGTLGYWTRTGTNLYNTNQGDNVGIGTTSPGAKLEIEDSGSGYLNLLTLDNTYTSIGSSVGMLFNLHESGGGSTPSGYLKVGKQGAYTTGVGTSLDAYFSVELMNNDAIGEKLRITSEGNVGIGTTNPTAKLVINGGEWTDAQMNFTNTSGGYGQFNFYDTTDNAQRWAFGVVAPNYVGAGEIPNGGFFIYQGIKSDGSIINEDRLAIDDNGNVGIGTTSPGYKLDVAGVVNATGLKINGVDVGTSSSSYWNAATGGISYTAGNVGIGTTSPGYALDINSVGAAGSIWRGSRGTSIMAAYQASNSVGYLGMTSNNDLNIISNDLVRMTVLAGGNVGIGTVAPGYKLDVAGTFNATSVYSNGVLLSPGTGSNWSVYGSNIARTAGNVGIGTTSPGAKLQIGSVELTTNIPNLLVYGGSEDDQTIPIADFRTWNDHPALFISNAYGNVGIGTTGPTGKLDLMDGTFYLTDTDVAQPTNVTFPATAYGSLYPVSETAGGLSILGMSDTDANAMTLYAIIGTNDPTDTTPAMIFNSQKFNTTSSSQALGASETAFQFVSGANKLVTILGSGNVGIGTTNPISMLSVGASSQFQVNSTGNIVLLNNVITSFPSEQGAAGSIMTNNGSGTLSWGSPSGTGVLGYWTRTGTNLYNTNQGDNVGIGTTNPANVLDIGTGGGIHITTGIPGSTTMALYNNSGTLTWNGVALATGGSSISGTTNYIPVFTGAATLGNSVIYQSSGNVGIGTTSPTGILNVLGDTTSSGPGSPITLTGGVGRWGASYAGGAINLTGGEGSYGGGNTGTNNGGNVNITGGTAGTYGYGGDVVLTAGSRGGGIYDSGNIILQGGNVGIETLGPTSILSLGGTAARIFGMERNITTNSIGNNLTIRAGGATSGMVSTISILNGGTGGTYAVNDVLTLATPIGGTAATVTVTSVTAGVINGVSLTTKGAGYTTGAKTTTVAPAGGTGAVINVLAVGSATNKAGGNLLLSSGLSTGTGGSEIQFWTAPVGSTGATDNALTQKMVITTAGNVGIGTTNPLYTLTVNGTSWTTNNAWAGSDARWKTNVQPIAGALDKVLLLTGVSYNWRASEFPQNNFDNKTHLGLVAQDVENITPELVTTGADGYKGIDYNGFSALLINAIGEQQTQIGSLTGQLTNLSLPSTSDLQILRSGSSPLPLVINTTTGESIDSISAFAQSVIGELKAGSISTQELNAELVNIGGQSLQDYIGKIYLTASTDTIGIGTTSPSDTISSSSEPSDSASGSSPSGINILDLDGVIRINQSVITDTVSNTLYNNSDVLMWNDKQISAGPNLYSINGPVSNDEYLTLQHKQGTTDILVTAWVNDGTKWVKIANIGDSSDTTDDYYFTTPDKDTVRLHNKSGHSQSLKLDVFVSGADVAEWYTPEDTTADTPATTSAGTPTDTTISSDTAAASDITTGSTPSTEIIPSGTSPDTSIITTPADSTFAPSTEGTDTSDIKSGDIVAISTSIDDYGMPMVRKANAFNDSDLLGVVTTSASHEMGIQRDGRKLVALSGRVPVKIDPASPDIKPGDFLTSASLDGYAIKAEMPGRVIGTALQSWNKDSGDEKILVLVNPTYNSPTSLTAASTSLSGSSTSGDILNELLTLRDQIITLSNNLKDTISSLGMTLSKDEITGKDVLAVNSDMHILGDVTLANLTVTGDVQAGMVTIDTLFNSINVLGSSCYNSEIGTIDNTLCNDQALHLQKSGSGMIDMFDGKIVAKPDGTLVVENSIETKKLVINTSDVASAAAGKATIKSGYTRITINTSAVNDKSIIMITPERPVAVGSKYKEVGKFEIILKEAQTEDLNVSWVIVDRKD